MVSTVGLLLQFGARIKILIQLTASCHVASLYSLLLRFERKTGSTTVLSSFTVFYALTRTKMARTRSGRNTAGRGRRPAGRGGRTGRGLAARGGRGGRGGQANVPQRNPLPAVNQDVNMNDPLRAWHRVMACRTLIMRCGSEPREGGRVFTGRPKSQSWNEATSSCQVNGQVRINRLILD